MVRDPRDAVPGLAAAAQARLDARRNKHLRHGAGGAPGAPPPIRRTGPSAFTRIVRALVRILAVLLLPVAYLVREAVTLPALALRSPRGHAPLEHRNAFAKEGIGRVLDIVLLVFICAIGAMILGSGVILVADAILAFPHAPLWMRLVALWGLAWMVWLIVKLGINVVRWFFTDVAVGYWALVVRALAVAFAGIMVAFFFPADELLGALGIATDGAGEEAADDVALVPPPPQPLPGLIAQRRADAIARAYEATRARGDATIARIVRDVTAHDATIARFADAAGLPHDRVRAIIAQESEGSPRAVSPAGAVGLMQLMAPTAIAHGGPCGLTRADDRLDPEKNVCTGTAYLRHLVDTSFPGDVETALAAYNGGPGNVGDELDVLPEGEPRSFWSLSGTGRLAQETNDYVPSVLAWEYIFRRRSAGGDPSLPAPQELFADAGQGTAHGSPWWSAFTRRAPRASASSPSPGRSTPVPDVVPSRVWYTVQPEDFYSSIVHSALRDPEPLAIATYNQRAVADGLRPGMPLYLPEDRYAFHVADGTQTYEAIARRYRMETAQLLRIDGVWSDRDLVVAQTLDCDRSGCDDALRTPRPGAQVLVRTR